MSGADVFPYPTTTPTQVRQAEGRFTKLGQLLTDVGGDVDDGNLTLRESWRGDAASSATQDIEALRRLLRTDGGSAADAVRALRAYAGALETSRNDIGGLQRSYDRFYAALQAANGRIEGSNRAEREEQRTINQGDFDDDIRPLRIQYDEAMAEVDTARTACARALAELVSRLSPVDMRGGAAGGAPDIDTGAYQALAFQLNCAATTDRSMDADARAGQFRAFEETVGRPPSSDYDWTVARMLDPTSLQPKNQGYPANVALGRIPRQPGKGLVRISWFIPVEDVFNMPNNDLGDDRGFDPSFDPEQTRVAVYVDYENGLVIARNNPSVDSTGAVRVGTPSIQVQSHPDGRVRLFYEATNPFAPPGSTLTDHTVHGDIVVDDDSVSGRISDYPSFEVYRDSPDGATTSTIIQDAADTNVLGEEMGPLSELPFEHEVGTGGPAAINDFYQEGMDGGRHDYEWRNPYLKYPDRYPYTQLGSVDDPPDVQVVGP